MEIQAVQPGDRPFIRSYSESGFSISGTEHNGSVLVLPDRVEPWPVASIAELTVDHLTAVAASVASPEDGIEVLLIGCGPKMVLLGPDLRRAFPALPFSVDVMETGAACRTYNVLVGESRRVAAALTPIGKIAG